MNESSVALPPSKGFNIQGTQTGRVRSDQPNTSSPPRRAPEVNPVAAQQLSRGAKSAADPASLYEVFNEKKEDAAAERDNLRTIIEQTRQPSWFARFIGWFGIGSRARLNLVESTVDDTNRKITDLHRALNFRDRFKQAVAHNQHLREQLQASENQRHREQMEAEQELYRVQSLLDQRNELLSRIFRTNRLLSIRSVYASVLGDGDITNVEATLAELELHQEQLENAIRNQSGFEETILPEGEHDVNPDTLDLPDVAPQGGGSFSSPFEAVEDEESEAEEEEAVVPLAEKITPKVGETPSHAVEEAETEALEEPEESEGGK